MFEHILNFLFKLNLETFLGIPQTNLPKNTESVFGVFVTIKRYKKLDKWPEDIHGCIGYIDNERKKIPTNFLIPHVFSVSQSAMFKDDRNKYFPNILNDPNSKIEISYLKHPLYKVESDSGYISELKQYFDNQKYGLLIVDKNTKNQTTFLPEVFDSKTSWSKII